MLQTCNYCRKELETTDKPYGFDIHNNSLIYFHVSCRLEVDTFCLPEEEIRKLYFGEKSCADAQDVKMVSIKGISI